jgi:hypothetical protein
MEPVIMNKEYNGYGMAFRQSSDGKLHLFWILEVAGSSSYLISTKYSSPTAFSADYQLLRIVNHPRWWRIADNGVNRICSISGDGQNWLQVHSIGRTDYLTADRVGIVTSSENFGTPNLAPIVTVWNWTQA